MLARKNPDLSERELARLAWRNRRINEALLGSREEKVIDFLTLGEKPAGNAPAGAGQWRDEPHERASPGAPAPARSPEHRNLVNAILDRQILEQEKIDQVAARANDVAARVLRGARARREGGRRRGHSRAGPARVHRALQGAPPGRARARGPELLADLAPAIETEIAAAKGAGAGVEAIRAVERAARELEKKAKTDGNP